MRAYPLKKQLHRLATALAAVPVALTVASCTTVATRRVVYQNHPVSVQVVSEVIDEETLEYRVRFRNVGREIMTFDYTVADEPGVPHVDPEGPNSGIVKNLYPGQELEVPNPWNRTTVHVTLGIVTYGKQEPDAIERIYYPNRPAPAGSDLVPPLGDNPLLP